MSWLPGAGRYRLLDQPQCHSAISQVGGSRQDPRSAATDDLLAPTHVPRTRRRARFPRTR